MAAKKRKVARGLRSAYLAAKRTYKTLGVKLYKAGHGGRTIKAKRRKTRRKKRK